MFIRLIFIHFDYLTCGLLDIWTCGLLDCLTFRL